MIAMQPVRGRYFDGRTARDLDVEVELSGQRLQITGNGIAQAWPMRRLRALDPPRPGVSLRLTSTRDVTSRLVLPPSALSWYLIENAPNLAGRRTDIGRFLVRAGLAVALLALTIYLAVNVAPRFVASYLPQTWIDGLGRLAERSTTGRARQCETDAGTAALNHLAARVASARDGIPDFSLRVYRMPVLNAFTVPGGRIILTGKLIETSESPEEVAAVIAHELGHAANLDPEVQFIRILGLKMLTSLLTGNSGSFGTETATALSLLKYSRSAEWRADDYAENLLRAADIDPVALRHFLERVEAEENRRGGGALMNILSTHPDTEARIKAIEPQPPRTSRQLLDDRQWRALQAICSS